ncbi:MAG: aminotransferase class I/II-fold pyridoxal phosphate-dependent enzyme, partial [Clostridiaceae bacterium]|nr:aminotransferase class I/II-fold pyridoxal phosphate-dependent enzyme [Clostridiaceae bacterium]
SIDGLSFIEPQGAFYLFINISQTGLTSESFANGLLNEEKVVVVPGRAFGSTSASYVRLSYATSMDQLREGMARIARYVKRLMEKQDCI